MKRWKQLCLIFALTLIVAMYRTWIEDEEISVVEPYEKYIATANAREHFNNLGVEEMIYQRDGIEVYYPQFVSGVSDDKLLKWNQIIKEDVDKILDIYAFHPLPQGSPIPNEPPSYTLSIRYEIQSLRDIYSILYRVAFFSSYSAYPTDLVYTTNIDLTEDRRLVLKDLVKVDKDFVMVLSEWDMIPVDSKDEVTKAIWDYLQGLGDEALLTGFQKADIIGSDNYLGIYSYLTPDRLGLSISVPNYLGDHVEFEREYSKLGDALLMELP